MNILRQVDEWMRNNTGEVIGIHFTRNIPEEGRDIVFDNLVPLLEMMWGVGTTSSSDSATEMSTHFSSNSNTWPTLREAVRRNQRIFVFVDDELNVNSVIKPWINPAPFSALESQGWNQNCNDIFEHASRCNISTGDEELIIAIGYTLAVCIDTGQESCNEKLQNATEICYGFRYGENRTVNIVLVDFPNLGSGQNSVFEVVSDLNTRNVQRFIGNRRTTTDGGDMTTILPQNTTDGSTSSASALPTNASISLLVTAFLLSTVLSNLHMC